MWRYTLTAAALAVVLFVARAALAADEFHEGKVTAVGDGKITVLDNRDDDNDTFTVTVETKITRNGKPAKLSDVQPGDKAKVTAALRDGSLVAKEIAAFSPQ